MKTFFTLLISILFFNVLWAQEDCDFEMEFSVIALDGQPNKVEIAIEIYDLVNGQRIPKDRPCPRYSDQAPYFKYFIEWGDGTYDYTTENTKIHTYTSRAPNKIRVSTNYIYGTGKPPKSRQVDLLDETRNEISNYPDRIQSGKPPILPRISFSFDDMLTTKRFPVGKISYRNAFISDGFLQGPLVEEGFIRFHYNNKVLSSENFVPAQDTHRLYQDNLKGPFVSTDPQYEDMLEWEFNNLDTGEIRNIFFNLKPTINIQADQTREIPFKVELLNSQGDIITNDVVLYPILLALDPNLMFVNKDTIKLDDQDIEYEVRFQNIGEEAVDSITIDIFFDSLLDTSKLEILDIYPAFERKESNLLDNTIRITLTGFNMPGLNQKKPRVVNYNETIGGIKFKIFHEAEDTANYFLKNKADIRFQGQQTYTTNEVITYVIDSSPGGDDNESKEGGGRVIYALIALISSFPVFYILFKRSKKDNHGYHRHNPRSHDHTK